MEFYVKDYINFSKKENVCTRAIQDAIDSSANAGGGKVVICDGVYMTGTIILKSNVNLHI